MRGWIVGLLCLSGCYTQSANFLVPIDLTQSDADVFGDAATTSDNPTDTNVADSATGGDSSVVSWGNEPASFSVLSDWGFDALVDGAGWTAPGGADVAIVSDSSAPFSGPQVLQFRSAPDVSGGGSTYFFMPSANEIYLAFYWKVGSPFSGSSAGQNVISELWAVGDGRLDLIFDSPAGGPYHLYFALMSSLVDNSHLPNSSFGNYLRGNLNPTVTLALDTWHLVEVHLRLGTSTTSQDALLNWWIDGVHVANYSTVNFPGTFAEIRFRTEWGTGEPKATTDYFWVDHVRLSAP